MKNITGLGIREVRLQKHMTQAELAEKANLSQPLINAIEAQKRTLNETKLFAIADALNTPVDTLIDISLKRNQSTIELKELANDLTEDETQKTIAFIRSVLRA